MAQLGLDYSTARPGGAALHAAGVAAVGRYLGTDSRCIGATEYQDLKAHGVGVWLVFESQTQDLSTSMLNGYDKGVSDARRALAAITAVGLPAASPVYWAADFDIGPSGSVQPRVAPSESYVDGWNTIIPAGRRGGYGGLWFLNYLHGKGKIDFLWECASTSFRHGINPANVPLHIQQTTKTPPIAGTDHNYIFDTASLAGSGAATAIANPSRPKEADMMIYSSTSENGRCYLVTPYEVTPVDDPNYAKQLAIILTGDQSGQAPKVNGDQINIFKEVTKAARNQLIADLSAGQTTGAGAAAPTQAQLESAAQTGVKAFFAAASK
jgi:hypothetical protein